MFTAQTIAGSSLYRQMAIRDVLKAARLRAGLRHEDVADRIGVSRSHYTNWESGHGEPAGPDHLNALAGALGVPLEALLAEQGYNLYPSKEARTLDPEAVSLLMVLAPDQVESIKTLMRQLAGLEPARTRVRSPRQRALKGGSPTTEPGA